MSYIVSQTSNFLIAIVFRFNFKFKTANSCQIKSVRIIKDQLRIHKEIKAMTAFDRVLSNSWGSLVTVLTEEMEYGPIIRELFEHTLSGGEKKKTFHDYW